MDLVEQIIAYEDGQLEDHAVLELFAELIRTGQAWKLQGHYGRMAAHLIQHGWISPLGKITPEGEALVS